jgi:transposase
MSNVLSDDKQQQVLALGRLGWPLRRIEHATGVRRETASAYLRAAGIAIRPPRRWGRAAATPVVPSKPANEVSTDSAVVGTSNPANEVSTDSVAPRAWSEIARPSPRASHCEPYRDLIEQALELGRNAMAIWQDLVDRHGFVGRYASVRRFVAKLRGERGHDAHPVITTSPGEEGQVDYGTGPMVRDPATGKYRRTRLFVLTLGYSRKAIRLLTFRSSTRIWAELHERAFRRLGGAPAVIVLDNLREGVLTPDLYDPSLNPLYRDLLAHHGATALPCRVRHPDRKGKVESGIGHTQRTPLKGLRFESMEEAQAYLDHWDERWADTRIHGTTKRQVAAMFAEEKPALRPLPIEPFRYYQHGVRAVHLDGCVEVEGAYYSAPPGCIGRRVPVQWDGTFVRLLDPTTGQLLREHRRQRPGTHRIAEQDRPPRTPLTTLALLSRARCAGVHIGTLCQVLHDRDGQVNVRRIQGVLSLVKKHGAAAVDEACDVALEAGAVHYRVVRRLLERRLAPALSLRQVDPLIRELTQYRDLIQQRTQAP